MRAKLSEQDMQRLQKLATRHRIKLSDGVYSPGKIDVEASLRAFRVPPKLFAGKRVLDIGTWTGGFAFCFEELGAEVVAIDVMDPQDSQFDTFHKTLKSTVRFERMSVYELDPDRIGKFDIVFFQGVFYHLKHPVLAFERINEVMNTGGLLLGAGTTGDHYFEANGKEILPGQEMSAAEPFPMAFFVRDQFLDDASNWWIPNQACVEAWAKRSGFRCQWINTKEGGRSLSGHPRSMARFVAEKVGDPEPEFVPAANAAQKSPPDRSVVIDRASATPSPAKVKARLDDAKPSQPAPARKPSEPTRQPPATPTTQAYEVLDVSLGDLRRLYDYQQRELHGVRYSVKGFEYPWILTEPEWNSTIRALDVGCGYSKMPDYVQRSFGCEVWAADDFGGSVGESQWERERSVENHLAKYSNIRYVRERLGEIESSSLPSNYFDIIYSVSALEHVPPKMLVPVWEHMGALLRDGGELLHGVDIRLPSGSKEHIERLFAIEDHGGTPAEEIPFVTRSAYLYTKWVYKALNLDIKVPEAFKSRNVMFGNDVLFETVNVFTRDVKVYKKLYYHNVVYFPLLLRLRKR